MKLWSVGHSTRSFDEFVGLLHVHGIGIVADIRTVPKSLRQPDFRIEALRQSLPDRGIGYTHLPRLGGFRRAAEDSPNDAWRNPSFRGYADYAMTDEFQVGLVELRGMAADAPTAMMCAEAVWWRCHRRLVADRLVAAGDIVLHITSKGRVTTHEISPFAMVAQNGQITYPARPS